VRTLREWATRLFCVMDGHKERLSLRTDENGCWVPYILCLRCKRVAKW
jgi:hypothetical protein